MQDTNKTGLTNASCEWSTENPGWVPNYVNKNDVNNNQRWNIEETDLKSKRILIVCKHKGKGGGGSGGAKGKQLGKSTKRAYPVSR